jgi:hypothetical protein
VETTKREFYQLVTAVDSRWTKVLMVLVKQARKKNLEE